MKRLMIIGLWPDDAVNYCTEKCDCRRYAFDRILYHRGGRAARERICIPVVDRSGAVTTYLDLPVTLLEAGVVYLRLDDGSDIFLSNTQMALIANEVERQRAECAGTGLKTLGKWFESGLPTAEDYLEPGDKVDEDLIGYDFGPAKTPITLTAAAPDAYSVELGRSVYDATNDKMRLIREAFKKAAKVIVYITESGTAATGAAAPLTVTAKYGGTRGNDIHVSVVTNPVGGFDVTVYLDADATAVYEGVKTVEELIAAAADDKLVKFTGTGDLKAASGVKLAGGTNVTSANGDVTAFVDKMEGIKFNTLCFPVTDATLQTAAITKIKYMRESMGKGVNVVLPDAKSPDHEGVINVTNSVVVDGVELTHAEACAFVAGITASASCIKSNTYEVYNGATGIVDPKDNEAAIAAIKNGEMFFSYSEAGNVIIEYDINSLVSFKKPKDKTYSKNRVIRTLDAIQEAIQNNFPPNKYDNSPTGYAAMKGIGQAILKQYEDMGAIKNVDYDADFKIDESLSSGDEVYFIVAIQPVDSAEKLFFTVKTR